MRKIGLLQQQRQQHRHDQAKTHGQRPQRGNGLQQYRALLNNVTGLQTPCSGPLHYQLRNLIHAHTRSKIKVAYDNHLGTSRAESAASWQGDVEGQGFCLPQCSLYHSCKGTIQSWVAGPLFVVSDFTDFISSVSVPTVATVLKHFKLSRVAWSVAICACDRPLSKMPQPSSLESLGHCATDCILGIVSNQHGTRLKNAERQVPTLQDRLTGSLNTMKGSLWSE